MIPCFTISIRPLRSVRVFPFDLERGVLGEGRVCVTVPKENGFPDGMTIDAEGMLWIAQWQGGAVRRYDPSTGACLAVVPVPAPRVTCCCFGGEALDTLYISTARTETDTAAYPLAGGVFKAKVGVQGYEAFAYRGAQ